MHTDLEPLHITSPVRVEADGDSELYLDAEGRLTERLELNGVPLIVTYEDIPESDIVEIRGVRATSAVRTIIDMASHCEDAQLDVMIETALERRQITRAQLWSRATDADLAARRGAQRVRTWLERR